ncbi:uncharacterized protein [Ptychodera flava]|uniref:uncharacterized protein isoform X2 n=1 Tax=Ptychodera flava TaxID=63121 RepID=UPI00396A56B4
MTSTLTGKVSAAKLSVIAVLCHIQLSICGVPQGCTGISWHNNVNLSEITRVGEIVYELPRQDLEGNLYHGFTIIDESNKNERFSVNSDNGMVSLARYLDYGITSEYDLEFKYYHTVNSTEMCHTFNLTVRVTDDINWPPRFNESCFISPTESKRPENYPFPVRVICNGIPLDETVPFLWNDRLYLDPANGDCSFIIYFYIGGIVLPGEEDKEQQRTDPTVVCTDIENNDVIQAGTIKMFAQENYIELPYRLRSDPWFISRAHIGVSFLAITIASSFIFRSVEGAQWKCHVETDSTSQTLELTFKVDVIGCPAGKYGIVCDKDCICQNRAKCHVLNRACDCTPGWRGPACDIAVPAILVEPKHKFAYHGDYLTVTCWYYNLQWATWYRNTTDGYRMIDARNARVNSNEQDNVMIEFVGFTDFNAGTYVCLAHDQSGKNWTDVAVLDFKGCIDHKYGDACNLTCDCQNDAECHRYLGCVCRPGWKGKHCEQECPVGKYGQYCELDCPCVNNATCDHVTGRCTCFDDKSCGETCNIKCECASGYNYNCNATLGECTCVSAKSTGEGTSNQMLPILYAAIGSVTVLIIVLGLVWLYKTLLQNQNRQLLREMELENQIKKLLYDNAALTNMVLDRADLKVSEEIGVGQYGKVELADLRIGRESLAVAAKSLIPGLSTSSSYRDFCHEVLCLFELKGHPNIIQFFGFVPAGDPKYIIVEYAAKGDLLNYFKRLQAQDGDMRVKAIEEGRLLKFARDVTLAMKYMEVKKFVHRDLACRNILITGDYVAKIGDFGMGRDIYERGEYYKVPWTEDQGPLPLKWMPPEFLSSGHFTTKSDVWSFGVLLWEIASIGDTPYKNVGMEMVIKLIVEDRRRLDKPENCTDRLYILMLSCWHWDPVLRPTASELTEHLDCLMLCQDRLFIDVKPDHFPVLENDLSENLLEMEVGV